MTTNRNDSEKDFKQILNKKVFIEGASKIIDIGLSNYSQIDNSMISVNPTVSTNYYFSSKDSVLQEK